MTASKYRVSSEAMKVKLVVMTAKPLNRLKPPNCTC